MADHQTTQVQDHEHAEDEAQLVLIMQHDLVAEDSPLVAEDSGLARQAQCVPPTQLVMVAEDRALEEQDKAEAQPVSLMQQALVAEDYLLAGKILHILPTQQVLVAEDGALTVPDEVHNVNPTQQILVAEDLTAEAVQHDHPTPRDLVPEDLAAEEVHHVPHCNKLGKGLTKVTVEDAVFEITVVGIKTTDKNEPAKDRAARQKYRETTLKPTTSKKENPTKQSTS
jgi:hypothetical protein